MKKLLSQLCPALTLLAVFALLLGVVYPLTMTGVAQRVFGWLAWRLKRQVESCA